MYCSVIASLFCSTFFSFFSSAIYLTNIFFVKYLFVSAKEQKKNTVRPFLQKASPQMFYKALNTLPSLVLFPFPARNNHWKTHPYKTLVRSTVTWRSRLTWYVSNPWEDRSQAFTITARCLAAMSRSSFKKKRKTV